jgi:general secretion pathway protein H
MRARISAFTLLELLLVVAVIAIAAGLVSLSVSGGERSLREESERLAALFHMAQSEARVSGRTLAWEADLSGYSFTGQENLPEELSRKRSWPFTVERVSPQRVLFGREPVREPETLDIATPSRDLRLALDPLGNLSAVDCGGARCAASR